MLIQFACYYTILFLLLYRLIQVVYGISSRAYMPDANGEFNLPQNEIPYGTILHVEESDHSTMASGSNPFKCHWQSTDYS